MSVCLSVCLSPPPPPPPPSLSLSPWPVWYGQNQRMTHTTQQRLISLFSFSYPNIPFTHLSPSFLCCITFAVSWHSAHLEGDVCVFVHSEDFRTVIERQRFDILLELFDLFAVRATVNAWVNKTRNCRDWEKDQQSKKGEETGAGKGKSTKKERLAREKQPQINKPVIVVLDWCHDWEKHQQWKKGEEDGQMEEWVGRRKG